MPTTLFHFRQRSGLTQEGTSLTRKRDTTSAWVSEWILVKTFCNNYPLISFSLAALEMYESDLDTMQQRAEVQDAQLLTLREQKLAEVRKAA